MRVPGPRWRYLFASAVLVSVPIILSVPAAGAVCPNVVCPTGSGTCGCGGGGAPAPQPDPVTGVSGSPGDNRIYVSWVAAGSSRLWSPDATSYLVAALPSAGPAVSVIVPAPATSTSIPRLINGTPYTVSVSAQTNSATSAPAYAPAPITPSPLSPAPSGPRGIRGSVYDATGQPFTGVVTMLLSLPLDPADSTRKEQPRISSADVYKDGSFTLEVPQQLDPAVQAAVDAQRGVADFTLVAGDRQAVGSYSGSIRLSGDGPGMPLGLLGELPPPHLDLDWPTQPPAASGVRPAAASPSGGLPNCGAYREYEKTYGSVPVVVGEAHSWDGWTSSMTYSSRAETTVGVAVELKAGGFSAKGSRSVAKSGTASGGLQLPPTRLGTQITGGFTFNQGVTGLRCFEQLAPPRRFIEVGRWDGSLAYGTNITQYDGPAGFAKYGRPEYVQSFQPGQFARLDSNRTITYEGGVTLGYDYRGVVGSVSLSSARAYSEGTSQYAQRPVNRPNGTWEVRGNNNRWAAPGVNIVYTSTR